MADKNDKIREFLKNIPDKYDLLEEGVNLQIQKEYIDSSHILDRGELTKEDTLKLGSILFNPDTPTEAKKKALVLLAHLGTITAFKQIEKYYKKADKDLRQWAALSLQECKMFLESELTGQNIGYISSGLGGIKCCKITIIRHFISFLQPPVPLF